MKLVSEKDILIEFAGYPTKVAENERPWAWLDPMIESAKVASTFHHYEHDLFFPISLRFLDLGRDNVGGPQGITYSKRSTFREMQSRRLLPQFSGCRCALQ